MHDKLDEHRETWQRKSILRKVYRRWYKTIVSDLLVTDRTTLELGSGTGNFKEYYPAAVTSDIDPKPWLDMVFDAHRMPFQDDELGNIVMIDVLHHLADPVGFLAEAGRVIQSGGRLAILEPYISPLSRFVYGRFHDEPFDLDVNYYVDRSTVGKNPWDSNQAISRILFFDRVGEFDRHFGSTFKIVKKQLQDMLLYPASGGFEHHQLVPDFMVPAIQVVEFLLRPLAPLLCFRCYVVLEAI